MVNARFFLARSAEFFLPFPQDVLGLPWTSHFLFALRHSPSPTLADHQAPPSSPGHGFFFFFLGAMRSSRFLDNISLLGKIPHRFLPFLFSRARPFLFHSNCSLPPPEPLKSSFNNLRGSPELLPFFIRIRYRQTPPPVNLITFSSRSQELPRNLLLRSRRRPPTTDHLSSRPITQPFLFSSGDLRLSHPELTRPLAEAVSTSSEPATSPHSEKNPFSLLLPRVFFCSSMALDKTEPPRSFHAFPNSRTSCFVPRLPREASRILAEMGHGTSSHYV